MNRLAAVPIPPSVLQCLDILSNRTECPDFLFVRQPIIFGLQLKGQFTTDQLIACRSFVDTVTNRTERPGLLTCPAVIHRALPNQNSALLSPVEDPDPPDRYWRVRHFVA